MRAPEFWARDGGGTARLTAAALAPLGTIFDAAGRVRRALVRPWRAPVPVICVGNLTVGGAGKTPTTLALAARIARTGRSVHVLSRGYGGTKRGPLSVDPGRHTAREVGDEALLLAALAPAWVARDRREGARAAVEAGAELIVMDDGFQNPSLVKDLSLLVVDGAFGFGNGRMMPAGPLRERVADGLKRADAIVLIGPDRAGISRRLDPGLPLIKAGLELAGEADELKGRAVVAFAGIARPAKFFETLQAIGCRVVSAHAFADHHPYKEPEVRGLREEAKAAGALLVTTEKDAVRLPPDTRGEVTVAEVRLAWEEPELIDTLLGPLLEGGPAVAQAARSL